MYVFEELLNYFVFVLLWGCMQSCVLRGINLVSEERGGDCTPAS